jgi:hypothetical protein
MQITFTSPYQVTCDCGWYVTTITQMSESQAQELGMEHIQKEHTAQDGIVLGEGMHVHKLPQAPDPLDDLITKVNIRSMALTAAVACYGPHNIDAAAFRRYVKGFEAYLLTGEFSQ